MLDSLFRPHGARDSLAVHEEMPFTRGARYRRS